jgi:type VI secretion system protein ImpJ
MLISPQHLQQQDLYHESLLEERITGLNPYGWGAAKLELDERALASGQVQVREFRGVLPRGTLLSFAAGESEAPAARAVEGHFPSTQLGLDVYLAVPLERLGTDNYAASERERGRARYVVESRSLADATAPGNETTVEFARRNVSILFGDEPRDDYECLQLATIVRDAGGRLAFSEPFVPPLLRIGASPFVMAGLRRILAMTASRRRAVADERRHRDASSVEFAADDVTRYLALNALSTAIPVLKHASETGNMAPVDAYLELVRLAGQLMAFSTDADPSELPAYLHDDANNTFEPLFGKLTSLLRVAVATRVVTIALEGRSDGMHLAKIADERALRAGARYLLSVSAPVHDAQAYDLLPRVAKVGSWGDIPRFLSASTPGVPLTASPRPPREIPVRTGRCYFTLASDHAYFRGMLQERTIAVHLPPPFDPKTTAVELLAIPPE